MIYDNISANKRNSWLLVISVTLFLLILGYFLGEYYGSGYFGVGLAVTVAVITALLSYYSGDRLILGMSRAIRIEKKDYPQLFNVVEELSIAAGIPLPAIYVIDDTAPNAFATGRDPEHSAVAITTGLLEKLDLVIGAVHSRFDLSRARQTRRILDAMDNPNFTLLAHPSGRLIERREPYAVDMPRIIRHARERGCYLELNAHPERLDLLDTHCQLAREEGVLVSINSDAHSIPDFDNLRFGIGQARRGWLEKQDVLNTRPLSELRKLLAATR